MSQFPEQHDKVAQHYDFILDFESVRLSEYFPVELAITTRYIQKYIPNCAIVADIGVGVGHYAELLARRGCLLYLVDITQQLLDATLTRLRTKGLEQQIQAINRASVTNLECFENEIFDAVLMLGPLYHLCTLEERNQAVNEAARILKQGGILFAAGINRLTYLRELFREFPQLASARKEFHQQFLQDGNVDPEHAPPIGLAHLTTVAEFRQLFENKFEEISMLGVESFTGAFQKSLTELPESEVEAWLDLVEQTATTPEGLGMTDHFLYIGRKRVEF
ncbi:class I SAM-dependent methyltransferase [Microseira sp. BLCC-F43]|jgi:ubiquinone/menaquinone biosynthesis C-methylase UbiE|uniref:class I SAM-dependent methyltransferase n=1 Tax=Microseira sp. BLCC-F43 TaxID=3153602 RepID=UPI0035B96AED